MGIELVVFATVFTLIVLLTGGPGPPAWHRILSTSLERIPSLDVIV